MHELWIRRGGLVVMIAVAVLVAVSGGPDLSLGLLVPFLGYVVLFGTPQWFLRKRARLEPRLVGLALFELACAVVMSLCLPRGSSGGTYCTYTYGSKTADRCSTDPTRYTVPLARLFTGDTIPGNEPWLGLTIVAAVLGVLGALALWVLVYRHLRNDDWRDLDPNANPAGLSWQTLEQTGGPSTTRPAARVRRITDAERGS